MDVKRCGLHKQFFGPFNKLRKKIGVGYNFFTTTRNEFGALGN